MGARSHAFIFTHTDLDGAASAAIYMAVTGREPGDATVVYAEPYNLDEKLSSILDYVESEMTIAIMDLGINKDVIEEVVDALREAVHRGARVEWYDHHVWSAEDREAVEGVGVKLFVDRSTCAAGVVARYASSLYGVEPPGWVGELVAATCSADLWRWDHPLSPKLFRVLGRSDDEKWRDRVVEKFYRGVLWDEELEAKLEEYVKAELEGYTRVLSTAYVLRGGCVVAAAYKREGPPSNSMIGSTLLSRYDADIAVIVRPNGGISLRSRRVNVQRVAAAMGGGGHPAAAGARIKIPLWVRLVGVLRPRLYSAYAARVVYSKAVEVGVCGRPPQ